MAIWVIDTGSVIQLRREVPKVIRAHVTAELDKRVTAGFLVYPPEVLEELERAADKVAKSGNPDVPFTWAKKNAAAATTHGRLYEEARAVLARVPTLVDEQKVSVGGMDEADPYIVALAVKLKVDGHDVTIITEDINTKPRKMALADAAGVFKVPCVRMRTFLMTEAIWDGQQATT